MTLTSTPLPRQAAAQIADALGETEQPVRESILRVTKTLGEDRVRTLAAKAHEIQDAGGMMLPDGSRKRTLGGVFFVLAREELTATLGRQKAFQVLHGGAKKPSSPAAAGPAFAWADFGELSAQIAESEEVSTVKITVIGRPGKPVERGDVVLLRMKNEKKPTLPKGMPDIQGATDYMVLVARKQWTKIAQALAADPADKAIIEGYPTVRPDFAGITVLAQSATTTGIQAGKRAAQQAAAQPQ